MIRLSEDAAVAKIGGKWRTVRVQPASGKKSR